VGWSGGIKKPHPIPVYREAVRRNRRIERIKEARKGREVTQQRLVL
jgi:hypothetical protein